ncbi:MAG: MerR family transcriptional regulator [Chitinophagales bacterium]|nr:MerR family transcriptional regulator [Bacteroidota bacterium]
MPYKEKEIEKLYYSISEVAKQFGVATSLIRFWETEFDILKPRKTQKGNRLYTKKDIENFRLIYHLVKEKGYTLDGAKKKLKEKDNETISDHAEIISRLKNIRKFLETMYNEL